MIFKFFSKLLLWTKVPAGYRRDFWQSFNVDQSHNLRPIPWMNYQTVDHLENIVPDGAMVFEYGSGASTKYWISRGCQVVSIEHDRKFFDLMHDALSASCNYRLFEPEIDPNPNRHSHESPESYKSSDYTGYSFESYVKAIDKYPDAHFDLVVVDGRARPSCIKRSIPKLKSGGIMILDNSDRSYYLQDTAIFLAGWRQVTFRGPVRGLFHQEQTTLFWKP